MGSDEKIGERKERKKKRKGKGRKKGKRTVGELQKSA